MHVHHTLIRLQSLELWSVFRKSEKIIYITIYCLILAFQLIQNGLQGTRSRNWFGNHLFLCWSVPTWKSWNHRQWSGKKKQQFYNNFRDGVGLISGRYIDFFFQYGLLELFWNPFNTFMLWRLLLKFRYWKWFHQILREKFL